MSSPFLSCSAPYLFLLFETCRLSAYVLSSGLFQWQASQSAERCLKLATSADMEHEFVKEQVHTKATACKDAILDR